jgi:ribosome-associated protein
MNRLTNPDDQIVLSELKRDNRVSEPVNSGAAVYRANPERSLKLALAAARAAAENGGQDVVVMDMTGITAWFDYFVIATGSSRRQLQAMADEIEQKLRTELNDRRMNLDGADDSRWVVLDYGTAVVHLFDDETRKFYSLEALWADSPKLDLTETLKGI